MGNIAPEMVEQEFDRWADGWDIDFDPQFMTDEESNAVAALRRTVMKAMSQGRAAVDENGDLVYTLKHPVGDTNVITFALPGGQMYAATDKQKQPMAKAFAAAASMTGLASSVLKNTKGGDTKFIMAIVQLFMGG